MSNDNDKKTPNPNDNETTTSLINQGAYGCIYYPSLEFESSDKHVQSSGKYVSKLQKRGYQSDFEDFVGGIIQEIPNFQYHFGPVLKTYNIDLASINPDLIKECDAVTKFIRRNKSVLHTEYANTKTSSKSKSKSKSTLTSKTKSDEDSNSIRKNYELLNKKFVIQKIEFIRGQNLKKYLTDMIHIKADRSLKKLVQQQQQQQQQEQKNNENDMLNESDINNMSDNEIQQQQQNAKDAASNMSNTSSTAPSLSAASSSSSSSSSNSYSTLDSQKSLDNMNRALKLKKKQTQQRIQNEEFNRSIHKILQADIRKNSKNARRLISILFDCYERLLDCIQLLSENDIVHFDIKFNNIFVRSDILLPIMIDFGLSIYVKRLLDIPWSKGTSSSSSASTSAENIEDPNSLGQVEINKDSHYEEEMLKNETATKTAPTQTMASLKNTSGVIVPLNYYWRKHFYVHAPDYFIWPFEVHIMSYLIRESPVLSHQALQQMAETFTYYNESIEYMSISFKTKYMNLCIQTFSKYVDKPREMVLNELIQHWNKWDNYSLNVMFIKIFYSIIIKNKKMYKKETKSHSHSHSDSKTKTHTEESKHTTKQSEKDNADKDDKADKAQDEDMVGGAKSKNTSREKHDQKATKSASASSANQKTHISKSESDSGSDSDSGSESGSESGSGSDSGSGSGSDSGSEYRNPSSSSSSFIFENRKVKLKSFYFLNNKIILEIIELFLLNIHPNPEKRLTPEKTKLLFNSLFYNI